MVETCPYVVFLPWYENLAAWVVVEGYKYSATATGKAMFAKEDSYAKGSYKAATNEVVTVTAVELPGLEFQVPVKNDGSFSVKLPLKDAQDEYKLAVSADNVTVDDFVHYRDHGKTKTLSGEYQVKSIIIFKSVWLPGPGSVPLYFPVTMDTNSRGILSLSQVCPLGKRVQGCPKLLI